MVGVFDDGSTDATADLAEAWAREHPAAPVTVLRADQRLGKIGALNKCHQAMVTAGRMNEIVVILDADVEPGPDSIAKLLVALQDDPDVVVTTGLTIPIEKSFGRMASAFQIEVAAQFATELGTKAIRVEGRLFAYRVAPLASFSWSKGLIVEDTQITEFLAAHHLEVRSVFDAPIRVMPARGYRDFYKQTYRAYAAVSAVGSSLPGPTNITRQSGRAFLRAVLANPAGAVAYSFARLVASLIHRFRPMTVSDQFDQSASTKGLGRGSRVPDQPTDRRI